TAGSSVCGHDDRDFGRRWPCRYSGGREPSDDDIDFEADQLGGQFGKPVEASIRRSKLKSNVLPLHIPQIVQPLPKHPPKLLRIDIANDQCANGRHLPLLPVPRDPPPDPPPAPKRRPNLPRINIPNDQCAKGRHLRLRRARRERPRDRRAAECSQQFPPSDGDCHTPLSCWRLKNAQMKATITSSDVTIPLTVA